MSFRVSAQRLISKGTIIAVHHSAPSPNPNIWILCDGSPIISPLGVAHTVGGESNTPNLINSRYLRSKNNYSINWTSGTSSKTLTHSGYQIIFDATYTNPYSSWHSHEATGPDLLARIACKSGVSVWEGRVQCRNDGVGTAYFPAAEGLNGQEIAGSTTQRWTQCKTAGSSSTIPQWVSGSTINLGFGNPQNHIITTVPAYYDVKFYLKYI